MRNVYYVETPENIALEFELAGVGSRGVAVIIDTIIQNFFILIIAVIIVLITDGMSSNILTIEENTIYVILAITLLFFLQFGYYLCFEYFMRGMTPGKKIVGLKVIMANGEPVSFSACLIRNFIRIADMLPGIYGVGIISVVLSRRFMRVGDYAANTIVVKVRKAIKDFEPAWGKQERRNLIVTDKEEALLLSYYERKKDSKNPLHSDILESQIYNHFYNKIGIVPNLPDNFTRKVYIDKLMDYIYGFDAGAHSIK